jgi:hypothetical protein
MIVSEFVADFETTDKSPTRVWLWAMCDIETLETIHGETIEQFFDAVFVPANHRSTIYFHNLKFDGHFILYHAMHNLSMIRDDDKKADNSYSTLISFMNQWYEINMQYRGVRIKFRDSLKKLTRSVADVADAYGLPMAKLEIDHHLDRPVGYVPTDHEIEYARHDVQIVAVALLRQKEQGLIGMTIGSDAMRIYRKTLHGKFRSNFPLLPPEADKIVRSAYRGGYTYVNPEIRGVDVGPGDVYDVNSMYPWAMRTQLMPFGMPSYFDDLNFDKKKFPLYVVRCLVDFGKRDGMLPVINYRMSRFPVSQYIEESDGFIELCLTDLDLELLHQHHNVFELQVLEVVAFRGANGMFDDYIDYWSKVKAESTGARREIAKLMQNSLYGKFAKNEDVTQRIPKLVDGKIKLELGPEETSPTCYVPIGAYTTAWARTNLLNSITRVGDRFLYCDTDSLHVSGIEPVDLDIHPSELGKWKHELRFIRARYVQPKTYIEEYVGDDGELCYLIRSAGLPKRCHKQVTWDNFRVGTVYEGKLIQKPTPGGIVLVETTHELKG